ncbi:MAG: hypothetical protein GF317_18275 [Candidatus Lokiarchaeota archaeon]|nr:hypothetical protein [Candidatus Lokiarchaeota archaeon]MBD3201461.1 hypothetical protein [Candidatus Lokiarchaeota archaeon]
MDLKSKFIGGMIGSALGDCIGELAFRYSNRDQLLKEIQNLKIIRYTDDTAMALGIAESLIQTKGIIDTNVLGEIFHKNYNNEPYRGYGSGPPIIFRIREQTNQSYIRIASSLFGGEGSYGNGASMRITPLGLYYYDDPEIYQKAENSAIVTHTNALGIEGAALLAKLISIITPKTIDEFNLKNQKQNVLNELISFAKTEKYSLKLEDVKKLLQEDAHYRGAEKIIGSNVLAFTSVPFSIFCFLKSPLSFSECLLKTVLVSKDRDTVGAMVGGLLGAYHGISSIPVNWIKKLENNDYIEKLAQKLYILKLK